jgi:2-aminoadipate transaminase
MEFSMLEESHLSADARSFRPSAIRAFSKLIKSPSVISFAGGMPSPETFPVQKLAELADRVMRERPAISLQYGPTLGLPRLRESIAAICRKRGIDAAMENVLTTTGSQQALNLVAQALVDPGDVVLAELPSYIGGLSSFFARRAELVGVSQDDGGIDLESLRQAVAEAKRAGKRVKLLYTIPNFQNPSGRLMEQSRRDTLLALAEEHDFLIIEDDPYGELVYVDDADTTPMKARPQTSRVIYLGSFSKVLAPGLRSGWILAETELLRYFELAKEAADLCSGMLDQSIVDEFIAADELEPQIRSVRAFYRDRRNAYLAELERHFSDRARWTSADGGLFTFLTLERSDIDTREYVQRSIDHGVAYVPGAPFFVDGSGANTMRLTFAKESDERMREGVKRLSEVFAAN